MNRRKGFTFIELMVALVFFSALSAIAVPRIRGYKVRAYIAAMQSDLGNLKIAEEEHWADKQIYATDTASLEFRSTRNVSISITSQNIGGGYTAVATHADVPNRECKMAMGPEAAPRESGAIVCGPTTGGASSLPPTP